MRNYKYLIQNKQKFQNLESFIGFRRKQELDERLDELVKLRPEPSPVYKFGVVLGVIESGRLGRRGREVR